MIHKAWSSIEEVPYCITRSSVKFQGYMALKIVEFDPNWPFPDSNSSLNSLMAMKCYTKLETAKEKCPIVFQGHPSNFKVTRDKTSPILTQIGHFRTIGRSQLSNPSDLPCCLSPSKEQEKNLSQVCYDFLDASRPYVRIFRSPPSVGIKFTQCLFVSIMVYDFLIDHCSICEIWNFAFQFSPEKWFCWASTCSSMWYTTVLSQILS